MSGQASQIKVSVIIPMYNVEKYIVECLESVQKQTLKELEIICVNDGSSDDTLKMVEEYTLLDSRIQIINKENGGLSSARNAGMKETRGEYILFLDSDDYLIDCALERLYQEAYKENLDDLFYSAEVVFDTEVLKDSQKTTSVIILEKAIIQRYRLEMNFLLRW